MELRDYIGILGRRKWVIILTLLFTIVVVSIGALQTPPKYTASTQVRVLTTKTGGAQYVDYNVQYAERLVATYVKIATSMPVITELSRHVDITPDNIMTMVKVEVIPNTELFQISIESGDPGLSQYMANKLAQIIINQSKLLYSDDVVPVSIYIVEPASIPDIPSSPSPFLIILLGAAAGLVGGVGLALLFENLDTRLYTSSQIESLTKLKTVGDIPEEHGYKEEDGLLIVNSRLHAEAFRRLRTYIFSPQSNGDMHTVLITSAVTQDGKSSITANLGLSIAQSDKHVLIVDANLRWPKMHSLFQVENHTGLSDMLNLDPEEIMKRGLNFGEFVKKTQFPNLSVIPSGPIPSNPVELLGSHRMRVMIDHLRRDFDVILFDSPACLSVTDPVVLSSKVDGVLIIVRHGWVRREVLTNTVRQLTDAHAKILGVVANRTGLGTGSRFAKK
jgi:capsular exopolysaccharide synthesis family protein